MRVLTSTFFNMMLSVVFIRFISCFSVTTFCSFFYLSHLSSLLLASKSATEACFFTFFTFCGVFLVVWFRCEKRNQISHSKRRHSCDALLRVREPVYSHTHSLHISLYFAKSEIDARLKRTRKQKEFVCFSCLLQKSNPPISTLVEQKHGDEESDAVGHGESRRRCPRWYPRNWHTEYVFVLIGGWLFTDWLIDVARVHHISFFIRRRRRRRRRVW